jgi:MmpS family membrane protein
MQVRAKFLTVPTFAALLAASVVSLAPPASAAPPTITFEAFGPGNATTIDLDPSSGRIFDAALPFSKSEPLPAGKTLLQVVVVGSGEQTPGCRIKVNNQVVAEKQIGEDAHCVADISGMSFGDDAPAAPAAQGITYTVKGPGTALTINIEPGGTRLENVPLPFTRTVPDQPGQLLEVIGVAGGDLTANPGCTITVNGVVKADKPNGSDGLCVADN